LPYCGFDLGSLDRYVMKRLTPRERESVDAHLYHCRTCQDIVRETQLLVDVLLTAATEEPRESGRSARQS
jgi:hypothetical protein